MLKTKRLIIRRITKSDLDAFAELVALPEVMEFSLKGPMDREESEFYLQTRLLDHYEKYDYGLWALIEKKSDTLIGIAGLIHQEIDAEDYVELGYRLHPSYWRRGLATEACRAIMSYASKHYDLKELISIIEDRNTPSKKLSEKLGFSLWKKTVFHGFEVLLYKYELSKFKETQ